MRGIAAAAPLESADEISKSIDQRAGDWKIYPNPTREGFITLLNENGWGEEMEVLIQDQQGRIILQASPLSFASHMIELNFNKPSAGMYWVIIHHGGKIERGRLVIQ
jgi:hypothetical protein